MNIAAAKMEDLGTLGALERACFCEAWSASTLAAALGEEKYVILLARDEKITLAVNALGYVIGWNVGNEGELARVGIHPSMQRQGFGEQLTFALIKVFRARSVKTVFLEVRESNFAAQSLYQKCGFGEVGNRPNYYSDGETAVIMRVDL